MNCRNCQAVPIKNLGRSRSPTLGGLSPVRPISVGHTHSLVVSLLNHGFQFCQGVDKLQNPDILSHMDGKIIFWDLLQLAEFLAHFTGKSTAKFVVSQDGNSRWVLEFTGGF
jgi:hypothetical protein